MEKLFVPYEMAVRLNDVGFNRPCLAWYNIECKFIWKFSELPGSTWDLLNYEVSANHVPAPMFQQVLDWTLEEFEIYLTIHRCDTGFDYQITSNTFNGYVDFEDGPFDTPREAMLTALDKILDYLTTIKNKFD